MSRNIFVNVRCRLKTTYRTGGSLITRESGMSRIGTSISVMKRHAVWQCIYIHVSKSGKYDPEIELLELRITRYGKFNKETGKRAPPTTTVEKFEPLRTSKKKKKVIKIEETGKFKTVSRRKSIPRKRVKISVTKDLKKRIDSNRGKLSEIKYIEKLIREDEKKKILE